METCAIWIFPFISAAFITAEKRGFPIYSGAGACLRSRKSFYAISLQESSTRCLKIKLEFEFEKIIRQKAWFWRIHGAFRAEPDLRLALETILRWFPMEEKNKWGAAGSP